MLQLAEAKWANVVTEIGELCDSNPQDGLDISLKAFDLECWSERHWLEHRETLRYPVIVRENVSRESIEVKSTFCDGVTKGKRSPHVDSPTIRLGPKEAVMTPTSTTMQMLRTTTPASTNPAKRFQIRTKKLRRRKLSKRQSSEKLPASRQEAVTHKRQDPDDIDAEKDRDDLTTMWMETLIWGYKQ